MIPSTAEVPGEISVIMPCYNAEAYIEQAVCSTLRQSYGNVELLVIDDGSTDRSPEIIARLAEEFPSRMTALRTRRTGPYPARNLGLRHARGQFVAFLDADDYWADNCLSMLHGALVAHVADVAYCGWQNVGTGARGREPYIPPCYEVEDLVTTFLETCPWPIHAALIRREVMDAIGGFSERRFSAMDYDLWLRMLALKTTFIRVPEVLAFYRWHGQGQISSVQWRQALDAWRVRRDFVQGNPSLVTHLSKERLRDLVDGWLRRTAYQAYRKGDLVSAQKLFRQVAVARACGMGDLKHIAASLLPLSAYRALVTAADRGRR